MMNGTDKDKLLNLAEAVLDWQEYEHNGLDVLASDRKDRAIKIAEQALGIEKEADDGADKD